MSLSKNRKFKFLPVGNIATRNYLISLQLGGLAGQRKCIVSAGGHFLAKA